jgi:hypothetical protein
MKLVVLLTIVALCSAGPQKLPTISNTCIEDILGLFSTGKALVTDVKALISGEGADLSKLISDAETAISQIQGLAASCKLTTPVHLRGDSSCIGDILNLFNTGKDLVNDIKALISGEGSDLAKLISDAENAIA